MYAIRVGNQEVPEKTLEANFTLLKSSAEAEAENSNFQSKTRTLLLPWVSITYKSGRAFKAP